MQNEKTSFDSESTERIVFDSEGRNEAVTLSENMARHMPNNEVESKAEAIKNLSMVPLLPDGSFVGIDGVNQGVVTEKREVYESGDAVFEAVKEAIYSNNPYEIAEQIQMISEACDGE